MDPHQNATNAVLLVTAGLFAYAIGYYVGREDSKRELERVGSEFDDLLEQHNAFQRRLVYELLRRCDLEISG
jgi:hypothetical protein